MTTQSDSLSPFQTGTENKTSSPREDFTFRTMQDDLLAVQKNPTDFNKQTAEPAAPNTQPIGEAPFNVPVQKEIQKKMPLTGANPFVNQTEPAAAPERKTPATEAFPSQETKMVEVPAAATYSQPSNSAYKIIMIVIMVLIVGIISLSGYYFWITRTPKQAPVATQPVTETTVPATTTEEPVVAAPPVEKYSLTKPNYLTIDLANLSTTEIQTAISNVANELKDLPSQTPYEFVVVDTNNNPVAFQIFATAAKLNFSPALLATLGENFSLFIYNDNGNMRLGFSADILKADVFTAEAQKQEKTLPTDLAFMFLDLKPVLTTNTFKDGTYNNYKTRYLNLDAQETLSIDYAIHGNNLTLGTSKNTERAILDKLAQQQNTSQQQQTTTNTNTTTPQEALAQ